MGNLLRLKFVDTIKNLAYQVVLMKIKQVKNQKRFKVLNYIL